MKPSEALVLHRPALRAVVEVHRARNARVFGCDVHGLDTERSDPDLLIDPTPDATLFDTGAIRWELRNLPGVPVDVLAPDARPQKFRDRVAAGAVPL